MDINKNMKNKNEIMCNKHRKIKTEVKGENGKYADEEVLFTSCVSLLVLWLHCK